MTLLQKRVCGNRCIFASRTYVCKASREGYLLVRVTIFSIPVVPSISHCKKKREANGDMARDLLESEFDSLYFVPLWILS